MLRRRIMISMMVRRIFAGSVVLLLVAVSAVAAACDLSCAFASMSSDCHARQNGVQDSPSSGMNRNGMNMPGMAMPEIAHGEDLPSVSAMAESKSGHPSVQEMGACERQACDSGSAVSAGTNRSPNSHFLFAVALTEAQIGRA